MPDVIMQVNSISKYYNLQSGKLRAIEDISFDVQRGEIICIVGPSGCGKTTLLEIMAGLRIPDEGTVSLEGLQITEPNPRIGVVFQEESTFPWRTVLQNVEFGLEMRHVSKEERHKAALNMINIVGLTGFENARPSQISGGMKQRVALARTLVMEPEVVLMDEPFSALDEQTRLLLGGELLRIVYETNATVVLVTHSIQEAVLLGTRVLLFSARPGRLKDIIESPLPRNRDITVLSHPAFGKLTQQIWSKLHMEVTAKGANKESEISLLSEGGQP